MKPLAAGECSRRQCAELPELGDHVRLIGIAHLDGSVGPGNLVAVPASTPAPTESERSAYTVGDRCRAARGTHVSDVDATLPQPVLFVSTVTRPRRRITCAANRATSTVPVLQRPIPRRARSADSTWAIRSPSASPQSSPATRTRCPPQGFDHDGPVGEVRDGDAKKWRDPGRPK